MIDHFAIREDLHLRLASLVRTIHERQAVDRLAAELGTQADVILAATILEREGDEDEAIGLIGMLPTQGAGAVDPQESA